MSSWGESTALNRPSVRASVPIAGLTGWKCVSVPTFPRVPPTTSLAILSFVLLFTTFTTTAWMVTYLDITLEANGVPFCDWWRGVPIFDWEHAVSVLECRFGVSVLDWVLGDWVLDCLLGVCDKDTLAVVQWERDVAGVESPRCTRRVPISSSVTA